MGPTPKVHVYAHIILVTWFIIQLGVRQAFEEATSEWWFYWNTPETFPPRELSPGIVLAPISNHMDRLTHTSGNSFGLLLLGIFIEPRVGGGKMVAMVLVPHRSGCSSQTPLRYFMGTGCTLV